MIQYNIIDGTIPEGCRILSNKGVMQIDGIAPLDPSFHPPVFSGPSVFPIVDEFQQIDIDLDVVAQNGKSLIGGTVIRGTMPWGLMLDNNKIVGEVAELNIKVPVDFTPEEAPKWASRGGSIGTFNEMENIAPISLQTEEPAYFTIIKGDLAWGLTMTSSGVISGKVAELVDGGEPEPVGLGPLFDTARGSVGVVDEGQTLVSGDITIVALPRTGNSVIMYITKGSLPWGLLMTSNGSITGKVSELHNGGNESDDPAQKIKPVVNPKTINAVIGTPLSENISVTIPTDRTLMSLTVTKGALPVGLVLQGTTISGTPIRNTGTVTCELVAIDSKYVKSLPTTITFEVTA